MPRKKYFILFEETTGYILERDVFKSSTKVWNEELQRGTILEEQPSLPRDDPDTKTFIVAERRAPADRKDVHFDCDLCMDNLGKLSDGEAERLLKIASPEKRYQSFCKSRQRSEKQHQTERGVSLFYLLTVPNLEQFELSSLTLGP